MFRLLARKFLLGTRLEAPLRRFFAVKFRIRLINYIFQRIFRINSDTPWSVHYTSIVENAHKLKIGRGVHHSLAVSGHCYIQAYNGIDIGDDTIFGPGVKILSTNHDKVTFAAEVGPPIIIGKHCWLGANSVILAGITLGDNVIVGSGAVVTKSVPSGFVVGGVPAKIIHPVK